jgi:prophage regulatory protein
VTQQPTILRLPDVVKKTGRSARAIYLAMARSEFPRQVPLGARSVGWLESEVDRWILEQARKREGVAA